MKHAITIGKHYSDGAVFGLPSDLQTTTTGILGIRGSGKSHTAAVAVECLVAAWPRRMTAADIAAACPSKYEPTGGGFGNALRDLRKLGLIETGPDGVMQIADTVMR